MDADQLRTTQAALDESKHEGDWLAKPAIPATTVAATNTANYTMWVEVIAGTVTVVKVNGVSVGRVVGMFLVKAGGTIELTYSVAPTWKWFAV